MAEVGAQPRVVLGDYSTPQGPRNQSPIVLSTEAQNLQIKPVFYTLILSHQFTRKDHGDPHSHLETFYDLVGTMGFEDARLKMLT